MKLRIVEVGKKHRARFGRRRLTITVVTQDQARVEIAMYMQKDRVWVTLEHAIVNTSGCCTRTFPQSIDHACNANDVVAAAEAYEYGYLKSLEMLAPWDATASDYKYGAVRERILKLADSGEWHWRRDCAKRYSRH